MPAPLVCAEPSEAASLSPFRHMDQCVDAVLLCVAMTHVIMLHRKLTCPSVPHNHPGHFSSQGLWLVVAVSVPVPVAVSAAPPVPSFPPPPVPAVPLKAGPLARLTPPPPSPPPPPPPAPRAGKSPVRCFFRLHCMSTSDPLSSEGTAASLLQAVHQV